MLEPERRAYKVKNELTGPRLDALIRQAYLQLFDLPITFRRMRSLVPSSASDYPYLTSSRTFSL